MDKRGAFYGALLKRAGGKERAKAYWRKIVERRLAKRPDTPTLIVAAGNAPVMPAPPAVGQRRLAEPAALAVDVLRYCSETACPMAAGVRRCCGSTDWCALYSRAEFERLRRAWLDGKGGCERWPLLRVDEQ